MRKRGVPSQVLCDLRKPLAEDIVHPTRRQVNLFVLGDFLSRPAVDIVELHNQPVAVFVDVFVYHEGHPAIGVFGHRLRVALPRAPPLRLRRVLRLTVTRAI